MVERLVWDQEVSHVRAVSTLLNDNVDGKCLKYIKKIAYSVRALYLCIVEGDKEFIDLLKKKKKNDGFDVEEVEYRASRLTSL